MFFLRKAEKLSETRFPSERVSENLFMDFAKKKRKQEVFSLWKIPAKAVNFTVARVSRTDVPVVASHATFFRALSHAPNF